MIDDIYNRRILEFAGNMERLGRLPEPDAVAKVHFQTVADRLLPSAQENG